MADKIAEAVRFFCLNRSKIIAAVSGGMDSMCMLHALHAAREEMGFSLICAHLDHGIREESRLDAELVKSYCEKLDIPVVIKKADIPATKQKGQGLEEAARAARYEFLLSIDNDSSIFTAHHLGDLCETVLMNIIRGSGTRGLRGMEQQRGRIVRPLLYCTKEEIEAYAAAHAVPFNTDRTNFDISYTRNRIRHILMPLLKDRFNPNIEHALKKLASAAREDEQFINKFAEQLYKDSLVLCEENCAYVLDRKKLSESDPSVIKRLIRNVSEKLGEQPDQESLERTLRVVVEGGKTEIGGGVYISSRSLTEIFRDEKAQAMTELKVPGTTKLGNWHFECILQHSRPSVFGEKKGNIQYFDYDILKEKDKLYIRNRSKGDRIRPLGNGEKTLGDFFTDNKIPQSLRDHIPLVAAGKDIVWAVGYGICDWAKVKKDTKTIIKIEFYKS